MHGAIVSIFLARNCWIAAVAKSTSQVTMPITAPFDTTLLTQDFDTSGFEFWVSQATILSFVPFTPPAALILAASSFAAVYAGLSNGAIWPLRSAANPMTIGFLADFAPDAAVTPTTATATATTSASPPTTPHLFLALMLPSSLRLNRPA